MRMDLVGFGALTRGGCRGEPGADIALGGTSKDPGGENIGSSLERAGVFSAVAPHSCPVAGPQPTVASL